MSPIALSSITDRCRQLLAKGAKLSATSLATALEVRVTELQGALHHEWFDFVQVAGPDGWLWMLRPTPQPRVTRQPGPATAEPAVRAQDFSHDGERTAFGSMKVTAERFGNSLIGKRMREQGGEWSVPQMTAAINVLEPTQVRVAMFGAMESNVLTRRKACRAGIDHQVLWLYRWADQ